MTPPGPRRPAPRSGAELDRGYLAVASEPDGSATAVRELPLDVRARHPAPPDRRRLMAATLDGLPASGELPELANVHWRERADEPSLRRADRTWTLSVVAHEVPLLTTAVVLPLLAPVLAVVSVFALGFAWVIPALYASRGAGVMRPLRRRATGERRRRAARAGAPRRPRRPRRA